VLASQLRQNPVGKNLDEGTLVAADLMQVHALKTNRGAFGQKGCMLAQVGGNVDRLAQIFRPDEARRGLELGSKVVRRLPTEAVRSGNVDCTPPYWEGALLRPTDLHQRPLKSPIWRLFTGKLRCGIVQSESGRLASPI
jgi:hypothetical protein